MSELQIEEGKWYRRRDGEIVGPARRCENFVYPWCLGVREHWTTLYTDGGRFRVESSDHRGDLVEEVPAPLSQNPADIAIASEIDEIEEIVAETAATTFGPLGDYPRSAMTAADVLSEIDRLQCEIDARTRDDRRNGIFIPDQKTADPRRAVDIADQAASLVGGDRDRQHGAKHDNFRRIAGVWNAWLAIRKEPAAPLDAHDVGCMMALMKLARTQSGALNVDDYVDACGYAACAGEVAQINET